MAKVVGSVDRQIDALRKEISVLTPWKGCNVSLMNRVLDVAAKWKSFVDSRQSSVQKQQSLNPSNSLASLVPLDDSERDATSSGHSFSDRLTKQEGQLAGFISHLQMLISYIGLRLSHEDVKRLQPLIAQYLLQSPVSFAPLASRHHSSTAAAVLSRSLRQRGGKAYIEFLCHHHLHPQSCEEWDSLCELYAPPSRSSVAYLPLMMPSAPALIPKDGCHNRTAAILSRLLSAEEAVSLVLWSARFHPKKHISSSSIALALRKQLQVGASRSNRLSSSFSDEGDHELQYWRLLIPLWENSLEAEKRDSAIARECGVLQTSYDEMRVEGSSIFRTPRASREDGEAGSSANASGASRGFNEMLTTGRWQPVLLSLFQLLGHKLKSPSVASSGCWEGEWPLHALFTETLAFMNNKEHWSSVMMDVKRVQLITDRRVHAPSKSYMRSSVTDIERELLAHPPTKGLTMPRRTAGQSPASGSGGSAVSREVRQLRQRLWALHLMPPHVAKSLIEFDSTGSPFLWRSEPRELLPSLLISLYALCAAVAVQNRRAQTGENFMDWKQLLQASRAAVQPLLFTKSLPNYAALTDYSVALFTRLASTLNSFLCVSSADVETVHEVVMECVEQFFKPPSPSSYGLVPSLLKETGTAASVWEALRSEWKEDSSIVGQLHSVEQIKESRVPATLWEALTTRVACLRNYHFSMFVEALSSTAALEELLSEMAKESAQYGIPVLCPESASAVLTSVLLQAAGDGSPATLNQILALLKRYSCSSIVFAFPSSKPYAVASYLRGIFSPKYLRFLTLSSPAAENHGEGSVESIGPAQLKESEVLCRWESPAALLVGRSIRLCGMYPITTADRFFNVHQVARDGRQTLVASFRPPPLSIRFCAVDVHRAVEYFVEKRRNDLRLQPQPFIVAAELLHGLVAINKPAGFNCTLHAQHPSLLSFLSESQPWCGRCEFHVPALHQHGLVNRIDVGTSGLVLATRSPSSLCRAYKASVERRIIKTYQAFVGAVTTSHRQAEGIWYLPARGSIAGTVHANGGDALLSSGFDIANRKKLPVSLLDRRLGVTRFTVLEWFPRHHVYHVEVELVSGRRHQIRQHFASVGYPLLGDVRYGGNGKQASFGMTRPALHASRVDILGDDVAESPVRVECPLPKDMQTALSGLRRSHL